MPIEAIFWAVWTLGFFLGGWRIYQRTDGFDMILLGFIFWFLIGLLGWNAFGSPIMEEKRSKDEISNSKETLNRVA